MEAKGCQYSGEKYCTYLEHGVQTHSCFQFGWQSNPQRSGRSHSMLYTRRESMHSQITLLDFSWKEYIFWAQLSAVKISADFFLVPVSSELWVSYEHQWKVHRVVLEVLRPQTASPTGPRLGTAVMAEDTVGSQALEKKSTPVCASHFPTSLRLRWAKKIKWR